MKISSHIHSKKAFWLSATAVLVLGTLTAGAVAAGRESLRGPHPWDFPDRNREAAFAYQYARDNRATNNGAGAAAIAGALGGTVIINNNTTAVGNWQQIEMTLGDGAEGLIMTESHQDNSGDATAQSSVLDNAFEVADRGHGSASAGRGGRGGNRNGHEGRGHKGGGKNGHGDRDKSSKGGERDHAGRDGRRAGEPSENSKSSHRSHESKSRRGSSDGRSGRETAGHESSRSTSDHDGRLSRQQDHNPCGYNGSHCWGDSETTGRE